MGFIQNYKGSNIHARVDLFISDNPDGSQSAATHLDDLKTIIDRLAGRMTKYCEGWNLCAKMWNEDISDEGRTPAFASRGYRRDGYEDCRHHICRRQVAGELGIKVAFK